MQLFTIHLAPSRMRFLVICLVGQLAYAQNPPAVRLTLQQAQALALQNHPRVLEAQSAAQEANQLVTESRAAYYPNLSGDVTASQGNPQGRIGAGLITDSRLFDRFGQGIVLSQLISDSGRTPNLVASSSLQYQASQQTYQATRFDVLVQVSQAYYDVLRANALIKVAEETIATRQLLVDQVSALAKNKLRSELDVSFADVNLAEANLL